jgi:hypothetical protein
MVSTRALHISGLFVEQGISGERIDKSLKAASEIVEEKN